MNTSSEQVCDLCGAQEHKLFLEKYGLRYVRCAKCRHVYTATEEFDHVAYNSDANAELHGTHSAKHDSARHIKAYDKLLDEFEPYRKTGTLLEIGSSSGAFLRRAQAASWQTIGVEPVAASAQHGIDEYGLDIRIGTLEQAALETASVDVAYSNAVIEHLESPAAVIKEAARVLRTGGLFYADTVNLASYTWHFLGERWKLVDPRMHLHLFTPTSLTAYCENAGLAVTHMTTHGVRFHATREDRPHGFGRIADELRKAPYSFAARRNLKGDNISVYARKI